MAFLFATPWMWAVGAMVTRLGASAYKGYTNSPPDVPSGYDGKENLFDEDNSIRILDAESVLNLVKSFIARIQTKDRSKYQRTQHSPQVSERGHRLGGGPRKFGKPPKPLQESSSMNAEVLDSDTEDFFRDSLHLITQTAELASHLKSANLGPNGSSAKAWTLYVSAAFESSLQVLSLYRNLYDRLCKAHTTSPLASLRKDLALGPESTLQNIESHFQKISICDDIQDPKFYSKAQLRLPVARNILAQVNGNLEIVGTGQAAANTSTPVHLKLPANTSNGPICYGTKVELACHSSQPKTRLLVLSSTGRDKNKLAFTASCKSPLTLLVQHADDRYRHTTNKDTGVGRPVLVRDRVMLKDAETGMLLGRTHKGDFKWQVGLAVSDDCLWSVSVPA